MVQTRLDARARSLLVRARSVGCGADEESDPAAALRAVCENLMRGLEEPSTRSERLQLLDVLSQVHALQCELSAREPTRRLAALDDARIAIERLRGIDDRDELLRRAANEACRGCGFERCIVTRVVDGRWSLVAVHFADDSAAEVVFAEQAGSSPRDLEGVALESSLLRGRTSTLIDASAHEGGILAALGPPALRPPYVACPIDVGPRAIGLVYAGGRAMDEVDRATLAWFVGGVAQLYERATLIGKLFAQRDHVEEMAASARSLMAAGSGSDIELPAGSQAVAADEDPPSTTTRALPQALTARELEVLALMAAGANNAGIADRLFLAEGTVKSHVKHIFRKMGANNRAEAVARYLHHHMRDVA